jgi:hypothetical protein
MNISHYRLPRSALGLLFVFLSNSSSAAPFNGFDLSNSLIERSKILAGGPEKDGIPAIDQAHFIKPGQATFLKPGDRILGIEINGISKAYPIKILNWHEIVNDHIGDVDYAITYCPLCGTGVAFSARVNAKTLNFGVSGLLYNSDVLLYDRQTESLWSQIKSQSISGKMAGTKLERLPITHTRWSDWRQSHPATKVMSEDTGYARDYDQNPYRGYEKSTAVYFRMTNKAPSYYHPKERVLSLEIDGQFKAYPFSEIDKVGQAEFSDRFAGRVVTIHWDKASQQVKITAASGKVIPAIEGFWFAWFAFHPDTEIFKFPKK